MLHILTGITGHRDIAMETHHNEFVGTIPENYERYFVPLIFKDYAEILAGMLDVGDGARVLETACGTGILTRNILRRLNGKAHLTATDFNEPMLAQAKQSVDDSPMISFQQADATELPFENNTFDAMFCQFGIMFFPNAEAAMCEAARVLKPGAKFHFSIWDTLENNGFANSVHNAIGALYPDDPPMFLTLPYGWRDITSITNTLQDAGFADIDVAVRPLTTQAPSARHIALGYGMGGPLANDVTLRGTLSLEQVIDALEASLQREYGEGTCTAPMQAIQFSATLPHS